MKKVLIMVGSLAAIALLATGCGSEKTLQCTMSGEESNVKSEQTITVNFKGDQANKVTLDMKMTVPEEMTSYMSMLKSTLEEQFSSYNQGEDKGSKLEVTTDKNVLKLVLVADTEKMDDATKKKLGVTSGGTEAETKKELEKQGYTCK